MEGRYLSRNLTVKHPIPGDIDGESDGDDNDGDEGDSDGDGGNSDVDGDEGDGDGTRGPILCP